MADNLERALEIAPDEAEEPSADRAITQLKSLRDGLQLTDKVLLQVMACGTSQSCAHKTLPATAAQRTCQDCGHMDIPMLQGKPNSVSVQQPNV